MTGENSNVKEKPMWGLKQALPKGLSTKKEVSDLANLLNRAKTQVQQYSKEKLYNKKRHQDFGVIFKLPEGGKSAVGGRRVS